MRPLPQDRSQRISTLHGIRSGSEEENGSAKPAGLSIENFHELFLRYSRPVLSFICAMIPDRSRAEELCQETFIRAFRKFDSRSGNASISTWLFGIARNVIREAVKEKYRELRRVSLDDSLARNLHAGALRADQQLIAEELNDQIRDSLRILTEDQRLVFVLKLIHRLRYEEIADITGDSISKLKTDLHRARLEMRQNLRSYMCGEAPDAR